MALTGEKKREYMKTYSKRYYEANKDRIAEKAKAYREDNRGKEEARHKAYREANKEKIAAYVQRRSGLATKTSDLFKRVRELFEQHLQAKARWGRNELLVQYDQAINEALMEAVNATVQA